MSENEKDRLYKWAVLNSKRNNEGNCFTKIDKNQESYYEKYEDREYLTEYKFQTVPELREELQKLWPNEECMKQIETVVIVAAMKNCKKIYENNNINEVMEEQLKPYIYNF